MPLKVLALNCTLKPSPTPSSTEKLLSELLDALREYDADGDIVRVADFNIKPGVSSDEGPGDDWPDLRERVIGSPEISTDGFHPYRPAIRSAFGNRIAHGVIVKTYSVTNLAVKEAARRYSPAQVIAVEREVVSGIPAQISTSYVERSNLTLRMSSKRFARLSNGFSKKLEPHLAAVSLYVAHYNLCRVHESLRSTPAMALGIAERVWTIGDLLDAAMATQPIDPVVTAPNRRKRFTVIEGGKV